MKQFIVQSICIIAGCLLIGLAHNHLGERIPLFAFEPRYVVVRQVQDPDAPAQPDILIDRETLQAALEREDILILDARDHSDYVDGHIAGAVSLPISDYDTHIERISAVYPPDIEVVVYCSSATCELADALAQRLFAEKIFSNIKIYRQGMADWSNAQCPIETGEANE